MMLLGEGLLQGPYLILFTNTLILKFPSHVCLFSEPSSFGWEILASYNIYFLPGYGLLIWLVHCPGVKYHRLKYRLFLTELFRIS